MQKARIYITEKLSGRYADGEIRNFYYLILEYLTGLELSRLLAENSDLSEEIHRSFEQIVDRLQHFEPIQHIFGSAVFYRLPFKVNQSVLIPRPETEELVEWILSMNVDKKNLSLLDIGTGSGCIAISLAKHRPDWSITAVDISPDALAVAKENADENGVKVNFIEADVFHSSFLASHSSPLIPHSFDIIVSNPPYIRELEKAEMSANVLDYEPTQALFVSDADPLIFYRRIARFANGNLAENGQLFFEINQYLGQETVDVLDEVGFKEIELRKDFFGNDRMILAKL